MLTYKISNAYGAKDWIREAGGKWHAATKVWTLTQEQYGSLLEDVEYSGRRSNKRDRALWTAWQHVQVEAVETT